MPPKKQPEAQPKRFKERRRPVLIVQHAPHEHPAAMRRALESQGISTICTHPYLGENYPETSEISGMISLGGPMGANDEEEYPWISREISLLRECVTAGLPVVGICLGGQMLARAMGGKVERAKEAEVGWFPIRLNAEGKKDRVLSVAGISPTVYHWHNDTFFPPKEATLLADSHACARQAYRIGEKVYGFQFHPEADHQLVLEWLEVHGTHDDIEEVRKKFGSVSIQDSQTQRNYAMKGEKGSLKITAAIGALFRKHPMEPPSDGFYDMLETFTVHRSELLVEFEGSDRKPFHLRGQIASILHISTGDFVIFQDTNTLLWPIRVDDILRISPLA